MRPTSIRRAVLVPFVTALCACGGSGSGDGLDLFGTSPESAVFGDVPDRDGFVTRMTFVSNTGQAIHVGDGGLLYDSYRGFLSFAHPAIPAGATILSATVYAYQVHIVPDPYTVLGNLVVDHVDIGADLDATDYDAPPLSSAIGVLSTSPDLGSRWLDVTEAVQDDVDAGRVLSEFRLRFEVEDNQDLSNDEAWFTDAEDSDGSGAVPALVVTWR